jgi:hypothetical protein
VFRDMSIAFVLIVMYTLTQRKTSLQKIKGMKMKK